MAVSDIEGSARRRVSRTPRGAAPFARRRAGFGAGFGGGPGSAVLAASLVLNLLGLALPIATLHVYDRVLPNAAVETLWLLTLGLMIIALLEFALRSLQSAVLAPQAAWTAAARKTAVLRGLLTAPARDDDESPDAILERLAAIDQHAAYEGAPTRLALLEAPFALTAIGVIALIAGPLALAPLAVILLLLIALAALGRDAAAHARARRREALLSRAFLSETVRAIESVKAHALEALLLRRHESLLRDAAREPAEAARVATRFQRVTALFGALCFSVTLLVGAIMAMEGALSLGALAASTLLAGRAAQPALRAAGAWREIRQAEAAAAEAAAAEAAAAEAAAGAERVVAPVEAAGREERAAPALDRGSAAWAPQVGLAADPARALPRGALIILRGGDAARRTAFLEEAAGLRAGASLLLDGVPAAAAREASPGRCGFTPRAPVLFSGSMLENLTGFGAAAEQGEALRIAAALGLDADLRLAPEGWEARYDDGAGARLSASAIKKIALARTLASGAGLLVLDAPVAGLDPNAAAAAIEAVRALKGRATILAASEAPALVAAATAVLSLDDVATAESAPS
ncbi:MAG: ABC transporter transmembrane domain-containing protein [Pseudomonadota bacterium]